ncbi:unnamed protein product [Phaeothamnion confervicola]
MEAPWLTEAEQSIAEFKEWDVLCESLLSRLDAPNFAELQSAEQMALVDAAAEAMMLDGDEAYGIFERRFGRVVDEAVATEAKRRGKRLPFIDLVLEVAAEGAVSALRRLPAEHRSLLRLAINTPLPADCRSGIWRLLLTDAPARADYLEAVKHGPAGAMSSSDMELTHRCRAIIDSGSVVGGPAGQDNAVFVVKSALSFCQRRGKDASQDSLILLMVPLALVFAPRVWRWQEDEDDDPARASSTDWGATKDSAKLPEASRRLAEGAAAEQETVAEVVEAFEALRTTAFGLWRLRSVASLGHACKAWGQLALGVLKEAGFSELLDHLAALSLAQHGEKAAREAVTRLLKPLVDAALVGFVSRDVCLFAWDQCLIAGFDVVLPRLAAMLAVALQEDLMSCTTFDTLRRSFEVHARLVTVEALKALMEKHCMKRLREELQLPPVPQPARSPAGAARALSVPGRASAPAATRSSLMQLGLPLETTALDGGGVPPDTLSGSVTAGTLKEWSTGGSSGSPGRAPARALATPAAAPAPTSGSGAKREYVARAPPGQQPAPAAAAANKPEAAKEVARGQPAKAGARKGSGETAQAPEQASAQPPTAQAGRDAAEEKPKLAATGKPAAPVSSPKAAANTKPNGVAAEKSAAPAPSPEAAAKAASPKDMVKPASPSRRWPWSPKRPKDKG